MKDSAEQIVASFEGSLRDGSATGESFEQAVEAISGLRPVTERDRMSQLLGTVRLLDLVLNQTPEGEGEPMRSERARIFGVLQRQYGSPETPYVQSRSIVETVVSRLASGEVAEEVASEGMQALDALEFDPEDEHALATARLAVYAAREAWVWLSDEESGAGDAAPVEAALRQLAGALKEGGFDGDAVAGLVREFRADGHSLDGTPAGHVRAVAVAVGLGLGTEPGAMPALETPIGMLAEAWVEASASVEESASMDFASRCEAVLAVFASAIESEGFSEYVMDQAVADLRELEPETEDDGRVLRASLVRLLDIAIQHAPPDGAETFRVARESILAQDAPPQSSLDGASVKAEGELILERLRAELEAGATPSAAVMRAITALQTLGARIADDDDQAAAELIRLMPGVVELSAPYAEAGRELLAEDLAVTMRGFMEEAESMMGDDAADAEIAAQAALAEAERLMHRPLHDPFEQPDARAHQRQFASLLRPLSDRLNALGTLSEFGPREAAEAKRISNRADIALKRLRNATTEDQWIEHQRDSLRRVVVDLRQFERRHHLTLIQPPWPTDPAMIDANAVFFNGGSGARTVMESACATIGMEAPLAHGVEDPVHTRWNLLRRSAVAVFDFTAYDPAVADPPGPMPSAAAQRAAIARAASPTARVAYECGWALALGTPIVILARSTQPPPFDIDVEPVLLDDDDDAAGRVTLAIQAALLGVQRGVRTADLAPTKARLRERFAGEADCADLLETIEKTNDPVQVRLAAEAMLERTAGRGVMLALPAFAPHRADPDGPTTLFHVTAFRTWSRPCEEVIRKACDDAGIQYLIGYERLDPDILGAIWRDIAAASFVVADLTNLNPNAALELAVAQVLGRPILVISRTPTLPVHLPALAKVRVHEYETDPAGRRALETLVRRFVAGDA